MTQHWYPCGEGWAGLCGDSKNALIMNEEKTCWGCHFIHLALGSAALVSTFSIVVCGCLGETYMSIVIHNFVRLLWL